jgi:hypothetical protein
VFALTAITAVTGAACAIATTLAPTPGPLGVGQPAAPGALVSACALAPSSVACQAPARAATVAVATVAVAAQHDLRAALCAQEQAGRTIHAHLDEPKVLDGRVRSEPHCCGTAFIGTV